MTSFKKKIISALLTLLLLALLVITFLVSPWGQPLSKALLLVPEVSPDFPIKPLAYLTKEPKLTEVKIPTDYGEIGADLYRPNDDKKHPGIVVALGTEVTRKNGELIPFARSLARLGYTVLIPDLPDFIAGYVWTNSSEVLISSYEFLENQSFVESEKIGLLGFCVGGSQSIVAAEDERISNDVSFVVALTPYYNFFTLSEEILAGKVAGEYGIDLTIKSLQKGFINYITDQKEKQLLSSHFLEEKEISNQEIEELSPEAKSIYLFLSNKDNSKFPELWGAIPAGGKDLLARLSPDTKISDLKAKLFIVYDEGYTYIPESQARHWKDISSSNKNVSVTVIQSLQHVKIKPRLPRWELTKLVFQLSGFIYKVLYATS